MQDLAIQPFLTQPVVTKKKNILNEGSSFLQPSCTGYDKITKTRSFQIILKCQNRTIFKF